MNRDVPLVAVTMGDPAGIGPEIAVKALSRDRLDAPCVALCIGDAEVMRRAIGIVGADCELRVIDDPADAIAARGLVQVLPIHRTQPGDLPLGRVSAAAGDAAFVAVLTAIELATAGRIDAVATGPLHKEALRLAGHAFPGHTEIFAHYTRTPRCTMMLVEGDFRVSHVSTHVSLRRACDAVKRRRVFDVIELTRDACLRFGIAQPRIGVAGLNPHAGDGGMFGDEEQTEIQPAIADAASMGWRVEGPFPPDTFFALGASGAFDACVAMHHDQGHIPLKMKGFRYDPATRGWGAVNGVNITLGLPIVRTSVDHGTAFDLAGTGRASEQSLLDAIRYAAQLSMTQTPVSQA